MYLFCQIKESSKIRKARQARVTNVSREGKKEKVKIILRHSNRKEERQFIKGAFFQVHINNDTNY